MLQNDYWIEHSDVFEVYLFSEETIEERLQKSTRNVTWAYTKYVVSSAMEHLRHIVTYVIPNKNRLKLKPNVKCPPKIFLLAFCWFYGG